MFIGLFFTLLAIINPLEALPVYLGLAQQMDDQQQRALARRACFYAFLLCLFFLFFGTLLLRLFEVPMSMVRVVGGVILMRVGFDLFSPKPKSSTSETDNTTGQDVAFVPLAMPIMFGPGAIATVLSMATNIHQNAQPLINTLLAVLAITSCMVLVYMTLLYSRPIVQKLGTLGIDAVTRIVGFFVAAMGMALIFNGATEFLEPYGLHKQAALLLQLAA